ncbi:hypothetical protein, partial [Sodalis-like endosymbiont of Proechinophthirus fluctus]|uniref:hypothetical protein n=1 Tax=Sodalis-like endosymbiont of Proechinophthirus fluctus TaxID=1462730 RepID=UPI0019572FEB
TGEATPAMAYSPSRCKVILTNKVYTVSVRAMLCALSSLARLALLIQVHSAVNRRLANIP